VVHLAGANRGPDEEVYETNVQLAEVLVSSFERTGSTPHLIYSSSTHETRDTAYGRSKLHARQTLSAWAHEDEAKFTGLIIPNVYGLFCRPFYDSVVATFCHQLTHGQEPEIKKGSAHRPHLHRRRAAEDPTGDSVRVGIRRDAGAAQPGDKVK